MGGGAVCGAVFRAERGRFALRALCVRVSGAKGDLVLRGDFALLVFGAVLLLGCFLLRVLGASLPLGLQISSRLLGCCTSTSRLLGCHWRPRLAWAFAVAVDVAAAEAAPAAGAAGAAGAPLVPAPLPADFSWGFSAHQALLTALLASPAVACLVIWTKLQRSFRRYSAASPGGLWLAPHASSNAHARKQSTSTGAGAHRPQCGANERSGGS